MKTKIIAFVGVLLAIFLALAGGITSAFAAGGDDTPVIALATGINPTGPTQEQGAVGNSDAVKIADEAGRIGAHVLLTTSTADQTPTTAYNTKVTGAGPNDLIRKTHLKKAQRDLVDAVTTAQRSAPAHGRVDVLSSIRHLADSLHALPYHPPTSQVVLWGSAWQNTSELRLGDPITLGDSKATVDAIAQQGLLPKCAGWRVHLVGAAQTPDGPLDAQREVQLREFYRQLLARCGGRLVEWSPDRLISFPGSSTEVDQSSWSKKHQVMVALPSDVLFDSDHATLRPTAKKALDSIVTTLTRTYPAATADIDGYTASTPGGNPHTALQLSWARARAVTHYFQAHGINPTRLKTAGHGSQGPVASNQTEKGRQANRRVQVVINTVR
ncbi:OmpA family protein [Streptomyces sp. NPDC003401]